MKSAIILAAGRGERLRPFTDHTPKPLAKVHGEPLIGRHLRNLSNTEINNVVVNVCWLKEQIKDYVSQFASTSLNIQISDEGQQALETGGGIKKALPLLGDKSFLAISADVFTDFDLASLPQLKENYWVHLVLVENPAHHPEGDFSIEGDSLCLKQNNSNSYTYSGIGIFHPELFISNETGQAFKIAPLIKKAIKLGKASAQVHLGRWSDVGTLERLDELNKQQ